MIQELVYTSAPKGLKLGSSGFCTVASSPGMAQNMASFLESLSGYRHLQDPGSPGNPVNFSYLKHRIGGQDYSILSRIADAGLDYSQRSNKIAHHLCLTHSDRLGQSPTSILASDVMISAWQQPPKNLPQRNLPRFPAPPPTVCNTWESEFGDAGWAGAMIDAALQGQNVFVILRPGAPALTMLQQAFSIMPSEKQWEISFSTFFTRLPPRVECRVRFVFDGSEEASTAKRNRNALVISQMMSSQPTASKYVDAARSGQQIASKPSGYSSPIPQPNVPGSSQASEVDPDFDDDLPYVDEEYRAQPVPIRKKNNVPDLPSQGSSPRQESPQTPRPNRPRDLPDMPVPQESSKSGIWLTLVICITLMILTNVGVFFGTDYYYGKRLAEKNEELQEVKEGEKKPLEEIEKLNNQLSKFTSDLKTEREISKAFDIDVKVKTKEIKNLQETVGKLENAKRELTQELRAKTTELAAKDKTLKDTRDKLDSVGKSNTQHALVVHKRLGYRPFAVVENDVKDLRLILPKAVKDKDPQIPIRSSVSNPWKFPVADNPGGFNNEIEIIKEKNTFGIQEPNLTGVSYWITHFEFPDGKSQLIPSWETQTAPRLAIKPDKTEHNIPKTVYDALKNFVITVSPNEKLKKILDQATDIDSKFAVDDKKIVFTFTKNALSEKFTIDSDLNRAEQKYSMFKMSGKENTDEAKQLRARILKLESRKSVLSSLLDELIQPGKSGAFELEVFLRFEEKNLLPPAYKFEVYFPNPPNRNPNAGGSLGAAGKK